MDDKAIAFGMEFESLAEQSNDLPPNWGCLCNSEEFRCEVHDNIFPEEQ